MTNPTFFVRSASPVVLKAMFDSTVPFVDHERCGPAHNWDALRPRLEELAKAGESVEVAFIFTEEYSSRLYTPLLETPTPWTSGEYVTPDDAVSVREYPGGFIKTEERRPADNTAENARRWSAWVAAHAAK